MVMHRRAGGFTLIELLIVVAIIAILAAIAVPNFLEAQTRAKVSRVKSDLRTLATGLETYTIDNNHPPYDGMFGSPHGGWVNSLRRLTTPISYMTEVPRDPFQDNTLADTAAPGQSHFLDAADKKNHSYDYGTSVWHGYPQDPAGAAQWAKNFRDSTWKVGSAGPDRRFDNDGSFYGMKELYDPTNGTVSSGDVYRTRGGQL